MSCTWVNIRCKLYAQVGQFLLQINTDIVTDTDKAAEIDVTRIQMLFFTVISAIFVALNIYDTNTIPAIDTSYVTLMGISNGVYITAKYVRR